MMKRFFIFLSILFLSVLINFNVSLAQEEEIIEEEQQKKEAPKETVQPDEPKEIIQDEGERQKSVIELFYKEKYEQNYPYTFEIVWNAIKESLMDLNCLPAHEKYQQTDNGLYKGNLKSDYCVFTIGDTTFNALKRYSIEVPFIRGGVWVNGRMQYKFKLTEKDDGTVDLELTGELSGFEDYVTHEVHFWKSNGILETEILKRLEHNCAKLKNQ